MLFLICLLTQICRHRWDSGNKVYIRLLIKVVLIYAGIAGMVGLRCIRLLIKVVLIHEGVARVVALRFTLSSLSY